MVLMKWKNIKTNDVICFKYTSHYDDYQLLAIAEITQKTNKLYLRIKFSNNGCANLLAIDNKKNKHQHQPNNSKTWCL